MEERNLHPTYRRIYSMVRRIPRGRVATYGQIAALTGLTNGARQIGYALHHLDSAADVPWHRVINSQGRVSLRSTFGTEGLQRVLLEDEGVVFDDRDRVDLEQFRWDP